MFKRNVDVPEAMDVRVEDLPDRKTMDGLLYSTAGVKPDLLEVLKLLGLDDTYENRRIAITFFTFGYRCCEAEQ